MNKVRAFLKRLRFGGLFIKIDKLARTAKYDLYTLDQLRPALDNKAQHYYLASLYLQLNQEQLAHELLLAAGTASREMKNYFHVLSYSRKNSLPLPVLSISEYRSLDYLDKVLQPPKKLAELLSCFDGVTVLGNAPGSDSLSASTDSCVFCFNHYRKNPRISGNTAVHATVHVVTPSYDAIELSNSEYLCFTGNSIFHRRSQVWKQFSDIQTFKGIYTLPAELWSELYQQLDGSPTAGLLILRYVSQQAADKSFVCRVGGFSRDVPLQNHEYDDVPFSSVHNWGAESQHLERVLQQLAISCSELTFQA